MLLITMMVCFVLLQQPSTWLISNRNGNYSMVEVQVVFKYEVDEFCQVIKLMQPVVQAATGDDVLLDDSSADIQHSVETIQS